MKIFIDRAGGLFEVLTNAIDIETLRYSIRIRESGITIIDQLGHKGRANLDLDLSKNADVCSPPLQTEIQQKLIET